ncbi:hypothetical protein [Mangrovactinospora gilvigrisea]|uniref:hypothetical protein n=1 Tax=Mangrovactinospora gilvigrisea TaxID=1428644 RepID=UPI0008FC4DD6|nr:hypothetical protein [Mangrovactinospora gilvigrisea]
MRTQLSPLQRDVRQLAAARPEFPSRHLANAAKEREQEPMSQYVYDVPTAGTEQIRSRNLQLLHEALARAQMAERIREAEHQRLARRVQRAERLRRRAERAGLKARKAAALVVALGQ